jgi:uncharacterized membrane protein (DUF485 family)
MYKNLNIEKKLRKYDTLLFLVCILFAFLIIYFNPQILRMDMKNAKYGITGINFALTILLVHSFVLISKFISAKTKYLDKILSHTPALRQ